MLNALIIIQSGESLPFKFDRGGESIENWTCKILVKQKFQDPSEITRIIPSDDDRAFSGFLTSTETTNLPNEGLWYLIGVLVNISTDEKEEIRVRFTVSLTADTAEKVANVTFDPVAGNILTTTPITLSTTTPGAVIHFTTDGTIPTDQSDVFEMPFTLNAGTRTVKAIAFKQMFIDSNVTQAIYMVT